MTEFEDVDLDDLKLESMDSLKVEVRGLDDLLKTVKSLSNKVDKRQQAEARSAQQQARAAAALAAEQQADWEAAAAAGPGQHEADIQEIKKKVDETLQEDAAAVQPDPPLQEIVVVGVQALPGLQLDELPELQQLLRHHQQLLAGSSSSNGSGSHQEPQAAAEALPRTFTWQLQDMEQLAVCPSEQMAKAVFRAVWCGGPELSSAAFRRYLGWCGLCELQAAADASWTATADAMQLAAAASAAPPSSSPSQAATGSGWSRLLHLSEQSPAASIAWLPSDADFLEAFRALGCNTDASSSASKSKAGRKQHPAAAAAAGAAGEAERADEQQQLLPFPANNLRLLLQLLTQLCRLAAAGKLPLQLGVGGNGQQVARLLLRLQLDVRVVVGCPGAAEEAAGAMLEVVGSSDWSRLVPHLLEDLAGGLGPSHRSSVLLMSNLPLTARGILLRQQGALLLLNKLMPGKRPAQQASRSTTRPDAKQLVALLGGSGAAAAAGGRPGSSRSEAERSVASAVRQLLKELVLPADGRGKSGKGAGSSGGGQANVVHDYWRLLNIVDAANLLLWVDMVIPGPGSDNKVRLWFVTWMEKLERELSKKLQSHRLRSRLTELINMLTFAAQLPGCNSSGGPGGPAGGDDDHDDLD